MREKRPRQIRMAECHPDRPHEARGMCNVCYVKWHRTRRGHPSPCHPDLPIYAKGMCVNCYQHSRLTPSAKLEKIKRERNRRAAWTPEQKAAEAERLGRLPFNQRKNRWKRLGCTNPPETVPDVPCEVCGKQGRVHLDHNHANGLFRGWLCNNCNCGLGNFRDSPELLLKAIDYLRSKT